MEKNEIVEPNCETLLPPSGSTVAVAIKGNRKSKYVIQWALEKFKLEANVIFKLLHVRARITSVPTPMGNSVLLSQVRDDVAAAYRKEMEWQTNQMILPYKKICAQKKVQATVFIIESDEVERAIAEDIAKNNITKLVIGASSNGIFKRKKHSMSSRISVCTPSFCTVYAVSKTKLSSIRPSYLASHGSGRDDINETNFSSKSSSSNGFSTQTDLGSVTTYSRFCSPSPPVQQFQALSTINNTFFDARMNSLDISHSRSHSVDIEQWKDDTGYCPSISEVEQLISRNSSCRSLSTDNQSWLSDEASTSDVLTGYSSDSQVNISFELEKLRTELRHVRGIYAMAQSETIDAFRKLDTLSKRRLEEARKLKEINFKEEEAKESVRQEKEKYEVARREAEYMRERINREASQKQEAEMKAFQDAREKEKLENVLVGSVQQYQKFTWEDIISATSSFSEDLKIGMGAYGSVYRCSLHHTTVAVKVLHSKEGDKNKQFQQELEILSKIHHPHLLLLLGACPDHGCLVYEYMENGSLEDSLLRTNNTSPIPWFERYRIAWEVASALSFLHSSKPKPIIHRDLKPANILLDRNFVSKIGDVGLAKMLSDPSSMSNMYKDTGPVGTLCYIDPEYQRTGLISPKSDVYAFGMIILQLLTAKPAIGLAHVVEIALNDGHLVDVLDSEAGDWPLEETKELATLGLSCAELQCRDRPDLKGQVLPALERLKEVADRARDSVSRDAQSAPPSHFICPILKDIMADPCVAADGYTYDRQAIEKWLEQGNHSPMTNLPLPHKILLPDHTLLSAIVEWKSRKQ